MSNCSVEISYWTDVGQDSVERSGTCIWQSSADTVTWRRHDGQECHFEMGEIGALLEGYARARAKKGLPP